MAYDWVEVCMCLYHLNYAKVSHQIAILLCLQLEEVHGNDGEHYLKYTWSTKETEIYKTQENDGPLHCDIHWAKQIIKKEKKKL